MTSQHKTNIHPFFWQAGKRPALIHFLTSQQNTGTHPFFMPSQHNAGTHPFFKTSQQNTGTHPFYIGMYVHIFMYIYLLLRRNVYILFHENWNSMKMHEWRNLIVTWKETPSFEHPALPISNGCWTQWYLETQTRPIEHNHAPLINPANRNPSQSFSELAGSVNGSRPSHFLQYFQQALKVAKECQRGVSFVHLK